MQFKIYAMIALVFSINQHTMQASHLFGQAKIALINKNMPMFLDLVSNINPANIDGRDEERLSLLHRAVMENEGRAVQALIAAGANVNQGDGQGDSPLVLSIKYNCDRVILNLLLDAGADPRLVNNQGQSIFDVMQRFLTNPNIDPADLQMALSINEILRDRADLLNQQDREREQELIRARHAANGRRRAEQVRADRQAQIDRQAQEDDRVAYLNYGMK